MNLITIVGNRPQFIKAAPVSRAIQKIPGAPVREVLIHTGQHYDRNMSRVFFEELGLAEPKLNLEVGSAAHGAQTGQMLEKLEKVLIGEKPDAVLVYGDTNSTLAGALAAVKLRIPVAHVEAGMRSFNRAMPEEINRIVVDHVSSLLLCSSSTAVRNLADEGIKTGRLVGDVMFDATLLFKEKALRDQSLERWDVSEGEYVLSTVHRAENTDDPERLHGILEALREISRQARVVLPLHPRTLNLLKERGEEKLLEGLRVGEPVSYLAMLRLEAGARAILTDSGGVQKEAFFLRVPCLTLRNETEWVETVKAGWNQICGSDPQSILKAWKRIAAKAPAAPSKYEDVYGDGRAAEKIANLLAQWR